MSEGILLLDKPYGKTSFFLVHLLRKKLGVQKIGHAGTLDPLATGLMVMLVGKKYTKQSDDFLHHDKTYETTLHLGTATTTYDTEGEVTNTSTTQPSLADIEKTLSSFQGSCQQVPPMYSAKKVKGKKLCDLARQGKVVPREPIDIELETTLVAYNYPKLELIVKCSKGTYIRTLADDIGKALGTFAHVETLRRTQSGPFSIDQAITIEALDRDQLLFSK